MTYFMKKLYMKKFRFLKVFLAVLLTILWSGVSQQVFAQPRDTVSVLGNKATVTSSKFIHKIGARYEWKLTGTVDIGKPSPTLPSVTCDPRFSLTDITFFVKPKIPLSDDNLAKSTCVLVPVACQFYLATGADLANSKMMKPINLSNSEAMKEFRFVPDSDPSSPNTSGQYIATVKGSNIYGQFMMVDRFDVASANVYYGDNSGNYLAAIDRLTPELLVYKENQNISDQTLGLVGERVIVLDTIDFGTQSVGSIPKTIFSRLQNRGRLPLQIQQIQVLPNGGTSLSDFQIARSDGKNNSDASAFLQREIAADTLGLAISFTPQSLGAKETHILIFCNDSTLTPNGNSFVFRFVVRGNGSQERITTLPRSVSFPCAQIGSFQSTILTMNSSGDVTASVTSFQGLQSPFSITSAISPFGAPQSLYQIPSGQRDSIRVVFAPTKPGNYLDTLIIRGPNIPADTVVITGCAFQDTAYIFHNSALSVKADTVIDFGSVDVGSRASRSFFVRNTGFQTMSIPSEVVPYFAIERIGTSTGYLEFFKNFSAPFPVVMNLPFESEQEFSMEFRPELDVAFYPLGVREARLRVSIRSFRDTSIVLAEKIFLLRVNKQAQLTINPSKIRFDSVYVGQQSTTVSVLLSNQTNARLTINEQVVRAQNPSEFILAGVSTGIIEPKSDSVVKINYAPVNRGYDSARASFLYTIPRTDSLSVTMDGVGVEQEIVLESAYENVSLQVFVVRKDTIDVGNVRVGTSVNVHPIVKNTGNIPFQLNRSTVPPYQLFSSRTPFADAHYSLNQVFLQSKNRLLPDERDTLLLRATPLVRGEHIVALEASSDIRQRVASAPNQTSKITPFLVRMRAVKPEMVVSDSVIDFGEVVVLPSCQSSVARNISILNSGDDKLLVSSPFITSTSNVFSLPVVQSQIISEAQSSTLSIVFSPTTTGTFEAILTLPNDAEFPTTNTTLRLIGRGVSPQIVGVSVATVVSAKPGREILMPILVSSNKNVLTSADSISLTLNFEKSLLEFIPPVETLGTALEGSQVTFAQENPLGTLSLRARHITGNFLARDTFAILRFRTYLGEKAQTEIVPSSVVFANNGCSGVLLPAVGRGLFELDSVCFLENKTLVSRSFFSLQSVYPNPAQDIVTITYRNSENLAMEWSLVDHLGRTLRSVHVFPIADESPYKSDLNKTVDLSVADIANGMYFLVMKAGAFTATTRLVISR